MSGHKALTRMNRFQQKSKTSLGVHGGFLKEKFEKKKLKFRNFKIEIKVNNLSSKTENLYLVIVQTLVFD